MPRPATFGQLLAVLCAATTIAVLIFASLVLAVTP